MDWKNIDIRNIKKKLKNIKPSEASSINPIAKIEPKYGVVRTEIKEKEIPDIILLGNPTDYSFRPDEYILNIPKENYKDIFLYDDNIPIFVNERDIEFVKTLQTEFPNKKFYYIKYPIKNKISNIKEIYGPYMMSILKSDNLTVIMFGENHTKSQRNINMKEMYIVDYLQSLFLANPLCYFDLFIERDLTIGLNPSSRITSLQALQNIYTEFKNCLSSFGKQKSCNNLRVHTVDARLLNDEDYNPLYEITLLAMDVINGKRYRYDIIDDIDNIILNLDMEYGLTETPFHANKIILQSIKDINVMIPEFENAKEILTKLYEYKIGEFKNTVVKFLQFSELYKKENKTKEELAEMNKLVSSLIDEDLYIMDIYALARISHKFSRNPQIARNIVIYAGQWHIDFYEEFFQSIGMELVYSKVGNINKVDVLEYGKLKNILKCSKYD